MVDLSGQVTICECKAAGNPEVRRKVVGQLFAYATALWGMPWETFAHEFERRTGTALVDHARELAEDRDAADWEEETFRQAVADCLDAGDFRLVLVVEMIPEELRDTVRFLNVHSASGLEVLAHALDANLDEVERVLAQAREAGLDLPGLTSALEREGVETFCASYDELLDCIGSKLAPLADVERASGGDS